MKKQLSILLVVIILGCASTAINPPEVRAVKLTWTNATTSADGMIMYDFKGSTIHYGPEPGSYTQSIDVGTKETWTLNIPDGPYCFSLTHYDEGGHISEYATEECKEIDEYYGPPANDFTVQPGR